MVVEGEHVYVCRQVVVAVLAFFTGVFAAQVAIRWLGGGARVVEEIAGLLDMLARLAPFIIIGLASAWLRGKTGDAGGGP